MQKTGGVWLPAGEVHLVDWMRKRNQVVDGKLTYQYHKLEAALGWVTHWRTAVDVGAHCGLWSLHLAKRFEQLHAMEPVAAHRECWHANMEGLGGRLYPCALGETEGSVSMESAPSSSGDTRVSGPGDIPLRRLDSYELHDVDFIKLDCEGYELFALRGGEETLKRCRPCVIVEQKPGRGQRFGLPETGAVAYLQSLGATFRKEIGGDFILSWD